MNGSDEIYDLLRKNKFNEAERKLGKLIKQDKNNLDYNFIHGLILAQKRDFIKALNTFLGIAKKKPNDYDVNFNCANCYQILLNFDLAIKYYMRCSQLNEKKYEPHHQIGICYKRMREYDYSISSFNTALKLFDNSKTHFVLGNVYREIGMFDKALTKFEEAISLDREFNTAKLSIINIEIDLGKHDSAEKKLNQFLSSNDNSQQNIILANIHLGNIYKSRGNYTKAIEVNKNILNIDKQNVNASYNLAMCYLFIKEYDLGWIFHEKRFDLENLILLKQMDQNMKKPRWDNSRPWTNILIWAEQGIGDQILYSQMIDNIKNKFNKITLAVNNKLIPFFKKLYQDVEIIDYRKIDDFDDYDYHLPMGSLGLYFQKFFKVENLNNYNVYNQIDHIPKKVKKIRCGISWKSTNMLTGHKKSIDLEYFKEIFKINNIEFINLQYSNEKESIENVIDEGRFLKHNVDLFNDIDGVASLISSCDFVITISNTNAHISGKLGIKTYLLLPKNDGKLWYWGLNTDDKIFWYPSVLPIRQNNENEWSHCINKLKDEIEKIL